MRSFSPHSFRGRLFVSFLAVTLIPLLLCAGALLQVFRVQLAGDAERAAEEDLAAASALLDGAWGRIRRAMEAVGADEVLAAALAGDGGADTRVYTRLYAATGEARSDARFDLYDLEGNWRYSTLSPPRETALPTGWGILRAAGEGETGPAATDDVTDPNQPALRWARVVRGRAGEPAGYVVAEVYQSSLRSLLEGKYGSRNDLLLLDGFWRGVYCAQPTLCAALAPQLRAQLLAGEALSDPGGEFSYRVARNEATGLYLALRQPQVFTRDTLRLLYTVSAGCALMCLALSVLMSLRFSRQLSLPVRRLNAGMDEVEGGNLSVQVPAQGQDELAQLTRRFNVMVSALDRNQEALIQNQRELDEAQIRMLQAQLNPHFLCNTLDTMKWISKINRVPQVAEMSTNLADILRFCISSEEFVPLRREAGILERYIEIQRIRLSGAFRFELELPGELEDVLVPKMILQPLVENAILHGLDGVEDGRIRVQIRAEGSEAVISVSDNGRGLPPGLLGPYARRERDQCRGHLGLYNVDAILRKHYGRGAGLTLENAPEGTGAVVTARLPIRREEEGPC